jgi:hypothetical protein
MKRISGNHLHLIGGMIILMGVLFSSFPTISEGGELEKNSCYVCHIQLGGRMMKSSLEWGKSIHRSAGITCDKCHGGNPEIFSKASMNEKMGFQGKPSHFEIPSLCGKCHSDISVMKQYNLRTDQYSEYMTSQHGLLLAKGDKNVAICTDCHGTHEILKVKDPKSPVFHTNVPETCGRCHSDEVLMKVYGISNGQYDLFRKSIHGKILYGEIEGKNPMLAPNCATCHGIHGAMPPGIEEVEHVCGSCHSEVYGYFTKGPHGSAVKYAGEPRCVDCHGNHLNTHFGLEMFTGFDHGQCGFCHDRESRAYGIGKEILSSVGKLEDALGGLSARIEKERSLGMPVTRLQDALSNLLTLYQETLPMTHSLDVPRIRSYVREGEDQIEIAEGELSRIEELKTGRKKVSNVGVALLIIIAGLFTVKLITVKKEGSLD